MPNKLPVLKTKEVERILLKLGFTPKRKRGSHLILERKEKLVVLPVHEGRDLPKGTLNNILKEAGIKKKDFLKFL